jgi:hypothetical protein
MSRDARRQTIRPGLIGLPARKSADARRQTPDARLRRWGVLLHDPRWPTESRAELSPLGPGARSLEPPVGLFGVWRLASGVWRLSLAGKPDHRLLHSPPGELSRLTCLPGAHAAGRMRKERWPLPSRAGSVVRTSRAPGQRHGRSCRVARPWRQHDSSEETQGLGPRPHGQDR